MDSFTPFPPRFRCEFASASATKLGAQVPAVDGNHTSSATTQRLQGKEIPGFLWEVISTVPSSQQLGWALLIQPQPRVSIPHLSLTICSQERCWTMDAIASCGRSTVSISMVAEGPFEWISRFHWILNQPKTPCAPTMGRLSPCWIHGVDDTGGATAVVYEASDLVENATVALKVGLPVAPVGLGAAVAAHSFSRLTNSIIATPPVNHTLSFASSVDAQVMNAPDGHMSVPLKIVKREVSRGWSRVMPVALVWLITPCQIDSGHRMNLVSTAVIITAPDGGPSEGWTEIFWIVTDIHQAEREFKSLQSEPPIGLPSHLPHNARGRYRLVCLDRQFFEFLA